MPDLTLSTSPLPEGTFPHILEIPPTQGEGGRQLLGKSSSDEPSRIFCAGTSRAQQGMSVRETLTERVSVHQSPQTLKMSERAKSDTLTERISETPTTPQPINLDNICYKGRI